MRYLKTISFLLFVIVVSCSSKIIPPQTFANSKKIKVLQLNIWQEGTMIPGGFDAIVHIILNTNADLVMLSEVRNYNNIDFTKKLITALKEKGATYYSFLSYDSGILSKYPVEEQETVFPLADDRGSIYKLVTTINHQRIAAYTAHLDYTHYACYLPRGYDGVTWKKLPYPVTDTAKIKEMNLASYREDAIKIFIQNAKEETAKGAVVFLGGDFNEPSFLDWTATTKDLYDHNGVIYHWDVSMLLHQAGFIDAYRQLYPSAVTHPGFTYPANNKDAKISQLTWAPAADERERIDFIYYYPTKKVKLDSVKMVGPDGSIVRGKREKDTSEDSFILSDSTWPTDHKGVLAILAIQ